MLFRSWGVSINEIKTGFGTEKVIYFQQNIEKYITSDLVKLQSGIYTLTEKGMFVSDEIMTNLMFI